MTEPTPTKYIDFRADDSKTEAEILVIADAENKIMTANDGDGIVYFIDRNGNRYRLSPNRAKVETPSGVVDGVNTDFELSQDPLGSAVIMIVDGLAQIDGFTVSGTTVTFDTAPQVTNGEAQTVDALYAFDQILNTGVMSFNSRTDTHIVPTSGDYDGTQVDYSGPGAIDDVAEALDDLYANSISVPTPVQVTTASHQTALTDRLIYVTYTDTGDATVEISTAFIAQTGVELEIHNDGSVGKVTVTTEGSEQISDYDDVELTNKRNNVGLRMMPGNRISVIRSVP